MKGKLYRKTNLGEKSRFICVGGNGGYLQVLSKFYYTSPFEAIYYIETKSDLSTIFSSKKHYNLTEEETENNLFDLTSLIEEFSLDDLNLSHIKETVDILSDSDDHYGVSLFVAMK